MNYVVTRDNGGIIVWNYEKAYKCRIYFGHSKIKKYNTFAQAEQALVEHLKDILPHWLPVPEKIDMNDFLTVKNLRKEFQNQEGHYGKN